MAFQAEIVVPIIQHFRVDRTVRLMTNGAAFAHRLVLEDNRLRLLAMASSTGFILPHHRQTSSGFLYVAPMRIMALDAIHMALGQRMMLGELEVGVDVLMATVASFRISPRIVNESSPAPAGLDMPAARPVARLTTGSTRRPIMIQMHPGMDIVRKLLRDDTVAFNARLVADKCRALNHRWRSHHGTRHRGTGAEHRGQSEQTGEHAQSKQVPPKTRPCGKHFG